MKTNFSLYFKPLALVAALAATSSVHGAGTAETNRTVQNPWAFDLTVYGWLPSIDGGIAGGAAGVGQGCAGTHDHRGLGIGAGGNVSEGRSNG